MGYFCENLSIFRDMVNFAVICQFLFRGMEYFSKYLKGYVIPRTPILGPYSSMFMCDLLLTVVQ